MAVLNTNPRNGSSPETSVLSRIGTVTLPVVNEAAVSLPGCRPSVHERTQQVVISPLRRLVDIVELRAKRVRRTYEHALVQHLPGAEAVQRPGGSGRPCSPARTPRPGKCPA